jgi:hypothetical protein
MCAHAGVGVWESPASQPLLMDVLELRYEFAATIRRVNQLH